MHYHLTAILLLLSFPFCKAQSSLGEKRISESTNVEYLVSLPKGYQTDGNGSAMILFLHGGDGSNTKHHPKKYAAEAGIEMDFMVVAPKCASGCNWSSFNFDALLTEVTDQFNVDKERIYVTGYSYGGYGTWSAISRHPQWFAAAVPIAGGGNTDVVCNAKNVAVWAFHGDKDSVTSYTQSKRLIEKLQTCEAKAKLETFEGADHWIWPAIYKDQRLYDWLSKQTNTQSH
ncbi:prolyl oligopeptidase family serine peptidase [Roseivirga sp. 4D4]|uniref:carboxylesterase family protein n=1 Tax=Roseivirga sp. 4D4 TaxID=1889784 RepID=UPI0009F6F633|nr:prolyl oligopeptidase family serine peptidase [Roseivirga sp. 4D4]